MGEPTAEDLRLEVVTFRAGGFRFACEARQVVGMRPHSDDAPTAEAVLGLPGPGPASGRVLLLRRPGDEVVWTVLVDDRAALGSLPVATIHRLPDLAAARLRQPPIKAVALQDDGLVRLVDLAESVARYGSHAATCATDDFGG